MKTIDFHKLVRFLLFNLFFVNSPVNAQDLPAPEIILGQVLNTYAKFTTYQDRSWAEKAVSSTGYLQVSSTRYSTFIRKPDNLRIEWRESKLYGPNDYSFLTRDQQRINVFLAWCNRYVKMDDSAGSWGTVFGNTGEVSFIVPSMMKIGLASNTPEQLQNLRLLPSQELEGVVCYILTGKDTDMLAYYRLWIGVNDYLLRQVEYQIKSLNKANQQIGAEQKRERSWLSTLFGSNATDYSLSFREIYRDIRVNQPIADQIFRFIPPPDAKLVRPDNFFDEKDIIWASIPDSIKKKLWIPVTLLLLSFGVLVWVVLATWKKRVLARLTQSRH